MKEARKNHSLVVVNSRIYAVGGQGALGKDPSSISGLTGLFYQGFRFSCFLLWDRRDDIMFGVKLTSQNQRGAGGALLPLREGSVVPVTPLRRQMQSVQSGGESLSGQWVLRDSGPPLTALNPPLVPEQMELPRDHQHLLLSCSVHNRSRQVVTSECSSLGGRDLSQTGVGFCTNSTWGDDESRMFISVLLQLLSLTDPPPTHTQQRRNVEGTLTCQKQTLKTNRGGWGSV